MSIIHSTVHYKKEFKPKKITIKLQVNQPLILTHQPFHCIFWNTKINQLILCHIHHLLVKKTHIRHYLWTTISLEALQLVSMSYSLKDPITHHCSCPHSTHEVSWQTAKLSRRQVKEFSSSSTSATGCV